MSSQSRAYGDWQARLDAGAKPTADLFAQTAFAQDPPKMIETPVARLRLSMWPASEHEKICEAWK